MVEINPIRIPGSWQCGYALDYHTVSSTFLGHDEFGHPAFDTKRTALGEQLYRLKYRKDLRALGEIVEAAAGFLDQWNPEIEVIIPVPPTRVRPFQPVFEIAQALGKRLQVEVNTDGVRKSKATPELKDIYEYHERFLLLEDAFRITDPSLRASKALVLDDLYRSGATLNAVTGALFSQASIAQAYALTLTRTRSSS